MAAVSNFSIHSVFYLLLTKIWTIKEIMLTFCKYLLQVWKVEMVD